MTANVVIDTLDSVLHKRPETFDGLRVNVASNVDFLAVSNAPMVVVVLRASKSVVRGIVVSENKVGGQNVLFNQAVQGVLFRIGSDECADAALALNESDDRSLCFLVRRGWATLHSLLSTKVHFIHFDRLLTSAQLRRVLCFVQHGTNLLKHAPCRLVSHSRLALNLFRADSATGRSHQVHGIEPSGERSGRFVKDRIGGRVNVVAAMIARIGRARLHAMMLGNRFARLAVNAFRVKAVLEPFQTGGVVRELLLEVFQSVRQHVRLAVVVSHSDYLQPRLSEGVPTVKG